MAASSHTQGEHGFSLIEVLAAIAVLTTAVLASADLFGLVAIGTGRARAVSSMTAMAQQKLEQLRALTWSFQPGNAVATQSDWITDLSHAPPRGAGPGLRVSPPNTLTTNTAGYVDYLDRHGEWVGTGATAPRTAVYVRRWNVQASAVDPDNTLLLQVRVTTIADDRTDTRSGRARTEASLATVKTRKAA